MNRNEVAETEIEIGTGVDLTLDNLDLSDFEFADIWIPSEGRLLTRPISHTNECPVMREVRAESLSRVHFEDRTSVAFDELYLVSFNLVAGFIFGTNRSIACRRGL